MHWGATALKLWHKCTSASALSTEKPKVTSSAGDIGVVRKIPPVSQKRKDESG